MKKLLSVLLAFVLVLSTIWALPFAGSVSADSVTPIITDGDFEAEDINLSGKLATAQGTAVATFNSSRADYLGNWYRASGGNANSDTDSDNVEWVRGGEEAFPTYFGPNSKQVEDPLNDGNMVLRSVQNLHQFLDPSRLVSGKQYLFKMDYLNRGLSDENVTMQIYLAAPQKDSNDKVSTGFDPSCAITDIKVLSAAGGVTVTLLNNKLIINNGTGPANEWRELQVLITLGDRLAAAQTYSPEAMALNLYHDVTLDSTNGSRSTRAVYYDDISITEVNPINTIGAPVVYDKDDKVIENPNDYAGARLYVDGVETAVVNEGDKVIATVDYDTACGCYEFLGWYKDGTIVSDAASITYTATKGEVFVPHVKSINVAPAASYEGVAPDTQLKQEGSDYPTGIYVGGNKNAGYMGATKAETIYTNKGVAIEQVAAGSVSTNGISATVVSGVAHSGNNSLKLTNAYWTASMALKVAPNTDYTLSYYIMAADSANGNTIRDSAVMTTLNVGSSSSVAGANAALNNSFGSFALDHQVITDLHDGKTWKKVTHVFNSMDLETVYLIFGQTANTQQGASWAYIDDMVMAERIPAEIDIDMKSCAAIDMLDGSIDTVFLDQTLSFKVIHAEQSDPVVKYNGIVVDPDEEGIYTISIDAIENSLSVRFAGDEDLNDYDKDYDGNDLSAYNEKLYLTNVWQGDTVYHEPALFIPGRETVKLLYPVDEVISLRSYSLEINYVEGVDYEVTSDGLIKILEGSRIPVYTNPITTTEKPDSNVFPLKDNPNEYLCFIGDTTYPKYAIAVTYKHSKTFEDGYQPAAPEIVGNQIKNTLKKLEAGEKVNIVLFGDSISTGRSSSGQNYPTGIYDQTNTEGNFYPNLVINVAPYAPTFIDMLISVWAQQYPGQVNLKNLSLGGKTADWGKSNIAARLALWKDEQGNQVIPDLIMVGFGVNDAGTQTAVYQANMQAIADNARTACGNADMEVLYYSPMLPNQRATRWDATILLDYEAALNELTKTDKKAGVINLTTVFAEVVKSKEAIDYLNTNVNHGNDFAARLYATAILHAFVAPPEPESAPGNINGDEENKVDLQDVVALAQIVAGWEDVQHVESALDVNGDGEVNLQDVVHLAQYVAGWDVELSGGTPQKNTDVDIDAGEIVG